MLAPEMSGWKGNLGLPGAGLPPRSAHRHEGGLGKRGEDRMYLWPPFGASGHSQELGLVFTCDSSQGHSLSVSAIAPPLLFSSPESHVLSPSTVLRAPLPCPQLLIPRTVPGETLGSGELGLPGLYRLLATDLEGFPPQAKVVGRVGRCGRCETVALQTYRAL